MSVKKLDEAKRLFVKTYTARELFDLVFTYYKNSPSELAKIPNLENLAKQRVSQIVNATGIPAKVIQDFFTLVQEVKVSLVTEVVAETAVDTAVYFDVGGGGDGGGGAGGGGGG